MRASALVTVLAGLLVLATTVAAVRTTLNWEDDIVVRSINRGFNMQCDSHECMFGSDSVEWAPNALKVFHPDGSLQHREPLKVDDLVCLQDTRQRYVEAYQDQAGGMLLRARGHSCTTQFQIIRPTKPHNATELALVDPNAPIILEECCETTAFEFSLRVALRFIDNKWKTFPTGLVEDEQSDMRELLEAADVQAGPKQLPEFSAYVKGTLYNYHSWPGLKRATTTGAQSSIGFMSIPTDQDTGKFFPALTGTTGRFELYYSRNMIQTGPQVGFMDPFGPYERNIMRLTPSAEDWGWTIDDKGDATPPKHQTDPNEAAALPKWSAVVQRTSGAQSVIISVGQDDGTFRVDWAQATADVRRLESRQGISRFDVMNPAQAGAGGGNNQGSESQMGLVGGEQFRVYFCHKGQKVGPDVGEAHRYRGEWIMQLTKEASRMGWRQQSGNELTPPFELIQMFPEVDPDDSDPTKPKKEPEIVWNDVTSLGHGWRRAGDFPQYLRTPDNVIVLRGSITGGAITAKFEESDSFSIILPHGARPAHTIYVLGTSMDSNGRQMVANVAIKSNGRVFILDGDNNMVHLNGIEFSANQPQDEINTQNSFAGSYVSYQFQVLTFQMVDAGSMDRILITVYGDKGNTGEATLRQGFAPGEDAMIKLNLPDIGNVIQVKIRSTGSDAWMMKRMIITIGGDRVTTIYGNAGDEISCPNSCKRYYSVVDGQSGQQGSAAAPSKCPRASSSKSYDYSIRCPEGWADVGAGTNYCVAPSTHTGCCKNQPGYGCVAVFTDSTQKSEKQSFSATCSVQWPSLRGDGTGADTEFSSIGRLGNGWERYISDANIQYFKDKNGLVFFRGQLAGGDMYQNNPVFVLPCSHRPQQDYRFPTVYQDETGQMLTAYAKISKDGMFYIMAGVKTFYMITVTTNKRVAASDTIDEIYLTLVGDKGKTSEFLLKKGMGRSSYPDVIHTEQDYVGKVSSVLMRIEGTDSYTAENIQISYNGNYVNFPNQYGSPVMCPSQCSIRFTPNQGNSQVATDNRNYGPHCPLGWNDMGGDWCQAPTGYRDCCDQSLYGNDVCAWRVPRSSGEAAKKNMEASCHVAWGDKVLQVKKQARMLALDSIVFRSNNGVADPYRTDLSLHGGWVADTNAPVGFFRNKQGIVYLRGKLMASDAMGGQVMSEIFVLPSGYRPSQTISVTALVGHTAQGVAEAVAIEIDGQGRVKTTTSFTSSDWISLDGAAFAANIEPPLWTAAAQGTFRNYEAWPAGVSVSYNRWQGAHNGLHNIYVDKTSSSFSIDSMMCSNLEGSYKGYKINVYHKLRKVGSPIARCSRWFPYWTLTPEAKAIGWVHEGNLFTAPKIYPDTMKRDDGEGNNDLLPAQSEPMSVGNGGAESDDTPLTGDAVAGGDGPTAAINIPPSWPAVVHMQGDNAYSQFALFFAPTRPSRYEIDRYYFLFSIAAKIEEAKKLTRWGEVLEETLENLKKSQDETASSWDKWLTKWQTEGEAREAERVKTLESLQDTWEKRLDGFKDDHQGLHQMVEKISDQRDQTEEELASFIEKIKQEKEDNKTAMSKKVSDVQEDLNRSLAEILAKFNEMKAKANSNMINMFGEYSGKATALMTVVDRVIEMLTQELNNRQRFAVNAAASEQAKKDKLKQDMNNLSTASGSTAGTGGNNNGGQWQQNGGQWQQNGGNGNNGGQWQNNGGGGSGGGWNGGSSTGGQNYGGQGNYGPNTGGGSSYNNGGGGNPSGGPTDLNSLIQDNDAWKRKLTAADDAGKMENEKYFEKALREYSRAVSLVRENGQVFLELLPTLRLK